MALGSALHGIETPVEQEDAVADLNLAPLDERIDATEPPRVAIVIGSDDARQALTEALSSLNAQLVVHENLRDLRRCLLRDKVDLVITDATLPDANWADVLRLIVRASLATELLVHSRTADEGLRSEVLWRGARGIVAPPYSIERMGGIARNTLPNGGAAEPWPLAAGARRGAATPSRFSAIQNGTR
jgi:DNA-binding NtrC family response regulator